MDAREALAKMVLPSHKRPAWNGGICQIMVGRACDLHCVSCSQGSQLAGRLQFMTPAEFETAVRSLDGYFGTFGVFGGNPCLSPHFGAYCEILRAHVPFPRRGLWSNHPRNKGTLCRVTFDPSCSNLNTHLSQEAYDEFCRDWPEAKKYLKGLDQDSVHTAPFVAIKDVVGDEGAMWDMISQCDVNKYWSSLLGIVPGRGLRAYFCELAFAQANLHCDDPDWPDVGLPATPGWWRKPLADFEAQIRQHCPACGIPLRRPGQRAVTGEREEFSETHRAIARPKVKGRVVDFVGVESLTRSDRPATEYLPGTTPKARP